MVNGQSVLEIVPGKNDREETIFSVIVKRSYAVDDSGVVARRNPDHDLRRTDHYYEGGDPQWATVQHEYELAAFKPFVDVVVIGNAHAPGGKPVQFLPVSVKIGPYEKTVAVFGDRTCRYRENALPEFSEPEPFTQIEIRYERAYGGHDEKSIPEIPFHYPRNPMGTGIVLRNRKEIVEGLRLPNIEDPNDLLTPERIILEEPRRWHLQPLPQGFGWRQRSWYPRSALLGSYSAFTEVGTVTAEERMGLVPPNHVALAKQHRLPIFEARFNNGASYGMMFPKLEGNERITLRGFSPEEFPGFSLPGEMPRITLDLGLGESLLDSKLHTVSIRPDNMEFDLIWRGALAYEGYRWLPQMKRLSAQVE